MHLSLIGNLINVSFHLLTILKPTKTREINFLLFKQPLRRTFKLSSIFQNWKSLTYTFYPPAMEKVTPKFDTYVLSKTFYCIIWPLALHRAWDKGPTAEVDPSHGRIYPNKSRVKLTLKSTFTKGE